MLQGMRDGALDIIGHIIIIGGFFAIVVGVRKAWVAVHVAINERRVREALKEMGLCPICGDSPEWCPDRRPGGRV